MSPVRNAVVHHMYRDSVVLMQISSDLSKREKVETAAVMMGTPANLQVLKESGLLVIAAGEVSPDDIILAVSASDEAIVGTALQWGLDVLKTPTHSKGEPSKGDGNSNNLPMRRLSKVPSTYGLALISVPGPYAAAEARKALRSGRHVFLFSDHVTIEDEVALKQEALEHDLLMMGPECGTSILSGIPLGFANLVHAGPIGVVAASGSGLQEITCLIDRMGSGITHAIGTGGRDLSPQVGGLTMLKAIDMLLADEATRVLVVLSKPPDPKVAKKIVDRISEVDIPVIMCFLGSNEIHLQKVGLNFVSTLEEAARAAVKAIGVEISAPETPKFEDIEAVPTQAGSLRGLFSGGTLAYEAMVILDEMVGPVWSNKPLDKKFVLKGSKLPDANVCLDLGSEEYTAGQPHPMINADTRSRMLIEQASDPNASIFLLDFILGYGSHPDPVGAMLPAIEKARQIANQNGRKIVFVASVTGTSQDPQSFEKQTKKLFDNQVFVASSNAGAARLAAKFLLGRNSSP